VVEFEGSERIRRAPEDVLAFVGDVRTLARYLPTTWLAEPTGPGRVEVAGTALGRPFHAEGSFRTVASTRRVEWGGGEGDHYGGWLQVAGAGEDASTVTLHLSFPGERDVEMKAGDAEHAIADTLRHLRAELEDRG
jgi:carbon monoxide dehydrogenase subunit G